MLGRRIDPLAFVAACLLAACSAQERPHSIARAEETVAGASGEMENGGASALTSSGGAAGSERREPRSATGAAGATEASARCGNGSVEPGEQCDGADFAELTCQRAGYQSGELQCTQDCRLDMSGCSGSELCDDLQDNDGDRRIDCEDSDCRGVCEDPCQDPPILPDPALVQGDLSGRTGTLGSACLDATEAAPAMMVYRITAAHAGVLAVSASADTDLVISLRDACDPKGTERACSDGAGLVTHVSEGDVVTLVLLGTSDANADGRFTLQAASRPLVCGDGFDDPGERCDDGNSESDDGCSSDCRVEGSESGNNDDTDHADPYVVPFIGEIYPAEDADLVEFAVVESAMALVAQTFALGEGACVSGTLDSVIEILDEDGTILGIDEDSGAGTCSKVTLPGLGIGRYFARVTAAASARYATFSYILNLDLDACGNGRVSDAEQCDDGNTTSGDGCSNVCEDE